MNSPAFRPSRNGKHLCLLKSVNVRKNRKILVIRDFGCLTQGGGGLKSVFWQVPKPGLRKLFSWTYVYSVPYLRVFSFSSVFPEATYEVRFRALEGRLVIIKSLSRLWDWDYGWSMGGMEGKSGSLTRVLGFWWFIYFLPFCPPNIWFLSPSLV